MDQKIKTDGCDLHEWEKASSMKKSISLLLSFLIILAIGVIYSPWFLNSEIIGGDWPYLFPESIKETLLFVPAWSSTGGNGLGGQNSIYFIEQYFTLATFVSSFFNISWGIVYRVLFFGLFLFLSIFSSIYFYRTVFSRSALWENALVALLYSANTYILMVVGGGQMGVALAYSMGPLVLAKSLKLIDVIGLESRNYQYSITNIQLPIITGLVLGLQIMFDPRIAYITMIAIGIYTLLRIRNLGKATLIFLFLPIVIAILLNSYWFLPAIFTKSIASSQGFFSEGSLRFLSFADFSHAFSLLHPNWPDNIFGKTYFLKPEFLILPILAFSSLLFLQFSNKAVIFLALLGLAGAFLAKGINAPFGEINELLFVHLPFASLFRDPTKFYMLIALSYSILIPYSISRATKWISRRYLESLFLLLICAFLFFLIRPAILRNLGGTFQRHEALKEYSKLKDLLHHDSSFSRTLWIPRQQRFTFTSKKHPAVEAGPLFQAATSSQILAKLEEKQLTDLAIKYIVVPYDSLGEIFLDDRKYDERQYKELIHGLEQTPWLTRVESFENIGLFAIKNSISDHFRLTESGTISYTMNISEGYDVYVSTSRSTELIFVENYSPYWTASFDGNTAGAMKTEDGLNSFSIPQGTHRVKIYFAAQKFYTYGRYISLISLGGIFAFLLLKRFKTYAH